MAERLRSVGHPTADAHPFRPPGPTPGGLCPQIDDLRHLPVRIGTDAKINVGPAGHLSHPRGKALRFEPGAARPRSVVEEEHAPGPLVGQRRLEPCQAGDACHRQPPGQGRGHEPTAAEEPGRLDVVDHRDRLVDRPLEKLPIDLGAGARRELHRGRKAVAEAVMPALEERRQAGIPHRHRQPAPQLSPQHRHHPCQHQGNHQEADPRRRLDRPIDGHRAEKHHRPRHTDQRQRFDPDPAARLLPYGLNERTDPRQPRDGGRRKRCRRGRGKTDVGGHGALSCGSQRRASLS